MKKYIVVNGMVMEDTKKNRKEARQIIKDN